MLACAAVTTVVARTCLVVASSFLRLTTACSALSNATSIFEGVAEVLRVAGFVGVVGVIGVAGAVGIDGVEVVDRVDGIVGVVGVEVVVRVEWVVLWGVGVAKVGVGDAVDSSPRTVVASRRCPNR